MVSKSRSKRTSSSRRQSQASAASTNARDGGNVSISAEEAASAAAPAAAAIPATSSTRTGRASRPAGRSLGANARHITKEEMERIHHKLGPEGTSVRREELVRDRESQLRAIVEEHDMAVKEKFHLERYISILEGWDPVDAKEENSPVFLEYKNDNYNLLSLIPSSVTTLGVAAGAGPSRWRAAGPSRTTRRQLQEKSQAVGHVTAIESKATGKGKGKAVAEPEASSTSPDKGKRKAGDIEPSPPASSTKGRSAEPEAPPSKRKGKAAERAASATPSAGKGPARSTRKSARDHMPPPPPPPPKSRKSRRVTIHESATGADEQEEGAELTLDESVVKGKKRTRQSLPNLPVKKARALRDADKSTASSPASSPAPASTSATPARTPSPSPAPAPPLPSFANVPFPPPPYRPPFRPKVTRVFYTDPSQKPPEQKYGGDLRPILESYIHIEDTGPPVDLKTLEQRAAREGYIRNRVNYLQQQGRLLSLLDEDYEKPVPKERDRAHQRKQPTGPPPRQTDYQDSLMAHMVQVRNAMVNEAKLKPQVCRRIARMIQLYWEHLENKDERERLAKERELKQRGKEVVKAIRKRWALAVKIVRARILAAQKLEQDRLGKEHLQNMLQRSTGLLEAQRDDFAGREDDDESEAGSDATEDVSAAEDSEAEREGEEGDDEVGEEAGEEGDDEVGEEAGEEAEQGDEDEDDGSEGSDTDSEGVQDAVDFRAALGFDSVPDDDLPVDEGAESDKVEEAGAKDTEDGAQQPTEAVTAEPAPEDGQPIPPSSSADMPKEVPVVSSSDTPSSAPPTLPVVSVVEERPAPEIDASDANAASEPMDVDETTPPNGIETKAHSDVAAPTEPTGSKPDDDDIPPPRSRSRRIAKRQRALAAASETPDPDANDVEFAAADASDLDDQDAQLDVEMEGAEGEAGADSEDEGLLADANMPIEELLKRYGYPMPGADGSDEEAEGNGEETREEKGEDVDVAADPNTDAIIRDSEVKADVEATEAIAVDEPSGSAVADAELPASGITEDPAPSANGVQNGTDVPTTDNASQLETPADQSLTDEALARRDRSPPALIVEGKRQRRVRSVWTPPEAPQHLSSSRPKKPKIKVVKSETEPVPDPESESDHSVEMTPEPSSEEEETDEEDEVEVAPAPEDPEAPRIKPPFLLRGTLRPYQHAGLEWLASLYSNNMNGILADEMGLGKTIQTIALLGHLACDRGVWGQHLIIVPTSVILNWEMEFKKFLPGMKVLTYYGNQKERKEKRVGWHTENAWQVCITSYQIVLADQHIFRRKNWVYMILDEAHNIKNFRSQRWQTLLGFKTQRRLLLTGTPLQNNLMELWSLLYFLMPNGITADATAVVGFANHKEFMEWFSNPMDKAVESGETLDDDMIETVSKLHTLLRPFILRRLKSEVETQLPGKFEHVVYCRLSKRQRFLYDEFMSRASTRQALTSGGYLGVMNTLMQLRKVCNHPDLFEVRPVRTSFAMDRGVASDFEPAELLLRKRLLEDEDERVDFADLNLVVTANENESAWVSSMRNRLDASDKLPYAMEPVKKGRGPKPDTRTLAGWTKYRTHLEHEATVARWRALRDINRRRCQSGPIYGTTTLSMLSDLPHYLLPQSVAARRGIDLLGEHAPPASRLVHSFTERVRLMEPLIDRFAVIPPNAVASDVVRHAVPGIAPDQYPELQDPEFDSLHAPTVRLQIAFPDSSLLQYDCGKLQKLAEMLRDLKADGHRVLIFTQMTRVLDILEMFLSYSGHRYLRLDGSTKIEDRQVLTERFNSDPRIFCFIASSRSGGVGINLTGADTVFFYDSDWNPSMDRQCMDRAHRIGQTRTVNVYRLVSSHTVEENMLKKANQKRLLDRVVIQDGDFTTEFFGQVGWRDMLDDTMVVPAEGEVEDRIEDVQFEEPVDEDEGEAAARAGKEREFALALAEVEDEEDAAAARVAQGEGEMDFAEFVDDSAARKGKGKADASASGGVDTTAPTASVTPAPLGVSRLGTDTGTATPTPAPQDEEDEYDEDEPGSIDDYMLAFMEWHYATFASF